MPVQLGMHAYSHTHIHRNIPDSIMVLSKDYVITVYGNDASVCLKVIWYMAQGPSPLIWDQLSLAIIAVNRNIMSKPKPPFPAHKRDGNEHEPT